MKTKIEAHDRTTGEPKLLMEFDEHPNTSGSRKLVQLAIQEALENNQKVTIIYDK